MSTEYEGWLRGIIAKRPLEILQILCDLLDAGLRNGCCSPNDIKSREWSSPKVVGATFKLLRKAGFRQLDRRIKPNTKTSHGRLVHVWELEHRWKAEQAKAQIAQKLLNVEPTGQMGLNY